MSTQEALTSKPFYRKEKKTWNTGHFPVGTIAKAKLHSEEEFEFIVKGVVCNGPKSYVIITDLPHDLTDSKMFNMSYVTRIVKRGDGPEYKGSDYTVFNKDVHDSFKSGHIYAGILISFMSVPYMKPNMMVDNEEFIIELFSQGVLRRDSSYKLIYNKRKLRKAVKRLLNKFLIRHKTAEYEEQETYDKMHEEDCFNDYIDPLPLAKAGVIVTVHSQEEFEKFKIENPELAQAQQETRLDMLLDPFSHWKEKQN